MSAATPAPAMATARTPPDVARLWRRVSSTHRIADLMDDADESATSSAPGRWSLVGALLLAAVAMPAFVSLFALSEGAQAFASGSAKTAEDRLGAPSSVYYALLAPLCVPTFIVLVFVNWFSWKTFTHA